MKASTHRIVAVATEDPLSKRSFSGLSANLFGEMERQGLLIDPIATRDLRWHDALLGAYQVSQVLQRRSRKTSRLNPDWYWSRRTHELLTERFRARLRSRPVNATILQVGTHVQAAGEGRRVFCITDLTVAQALRAGGTYQVGRTSGPVQRQALEWQREVFDGCKQIFVLSQWARQSVLEDYGISADKVTVVGAGANVPSTLPARQTNAKTPTVLFVGLDWEQKGGPLVSSAFHLVRQRLPAARLQVIGCRPPGLEHEPGVDVVGWLDRSRAADEQRLLQAYAEASCFCIAPAVDAFPNVLLEAAALGLPVVSTDLGSRREAVVDRVTGRLVPHDDRQALADALLQLLTEPQVAEAYGAAGAKRVRQSLTWPSVVRTITKGMGLD
jgi:glycosyltransferase involved in cell wall biosynthesis